MSRVGSDGYGRTGSRYEFGGTPSGTKRLLTNYGPNPLRTSVSRDAGAKAVAARTRPFCPCGQYRTSGNDDLCGRCKHSSRGPIGPWREPKR